MSFDPDHWKPSELQSKPDLRHLFHYENPRASEIARVIQEAERHHRLWFNSHQAPWNLCARIKDRQDLPIVREMYDFLRKHLADKVLVSLGAVKTPLAEALAETPPKVVINVDRYDDRIGPREAPLDPYSVTTIKHEPDSAVEWNVKADMLDFVSRLPDNSVNLQLDGIDTVIIDYEPYHRALAQELIRVLRTGGVLLGNHVDAFDEVTRDTQLIQHRLGLVDLFRETKIFEKPLG